MSWPAARTRLAPPGVDAIRLCRYSGMDSRPRQSLVGSRLLSRPGLVHALVADFDRLPASLGVFACPLADGSQIIALLAYRDGRQLPISTGLTGCELVTNGSARRTAGLGSRRSVGPRLLAELEQLAPIRARPQPPAGRIPIRGRWSVLDRTPLGERSGA
ncbi:MAG: hypothetical protein ACRDL5_05885, partial [Solirubrobacteraceae bacterium]